MRGRAGHKRRRNAASNIRVRRPNDSSGADFGRVQMILYLGLSNAKDFAFKTPRPKSLAFQDIEYKLSISGCGISLSETCRGCLN